MPPWRQNDGESQPEAMGVRNVPSARAKIQPQNWHMERPDHVGAIKNSSKG